MENPFWHNRAMNVIGQVLDADRKMKQAGETCFSSLEYRIAMRLQEAGLLTEAALEEKVGLVGRDLK